MPNDRHRDDAATARARGLAGVRVRSGAKRPDAHAFSTAAGCRYVKAQCVCERGA